MVPDRVIVRKLKEYDPHLFVEWNNRRKFFEVWRHMTHGRRLITPVTQSIYDPKGKIEYAPLDERIIMWLYLADSWRLGSTKELGKLSEKRWVDWLKKSQLDRIADIKARAREGWNIINQFTTTRYKPKNAKPTFSSAKSGANWVVPDAQARTSPRLFSRSKQNALLYNYQRKG